MKIEKACPFSLTYWSGQQRKAAVPRRGVEVQMVDPSIFQNPSFRDKPLIGIIAAALHSTMSLIFSS